MRLGIVLTLGVGLGLATIAFVVFDFNRLVVLILPALLGATIGYFTPTDDPNSLLRQRALTAAWAWAVATLLVVMVSGRFSYDKNGELAAKDWLYLAMFAAFMYLGGSIAGVVGFAVLRALRRAP